jgi:shikimate kinase
VILIGYRCAGKTTVGRALARRLGWGFVDTDEMVEKDAGRDVATLFREEGEESFRRREERAVARAVGLERHVVALGGGAVTREANRKRLAGAGGLVVFLEARPEELARRMEAEPGKRPPLWGRGGLEEIERLLPARLVHYQGLAERTVGTGGRGIEDVAAEIERMVAGERGS